MSTQSVSPAGGRRFWVTVVCFALFNLGVWAGYFRWQSVHRHQLLEVTQFVPGEGQEIYDRVSWTWTFNLDVAPPPPGSPALGEITPSIPGAWQWADPRTLKFTPESPLPRATPIHVTLNNDVVHTSEGFRLSKPFSASLFTAPLRVVEAKQVAFLENDRVLIELTFNDKVVPDEVIRHLGARSLRGTIIPFHPSGLAPSARVRIESDSIADILTAEEAPGIRLELSKGIIGSSGPLGLTDAYIAQIPIAGDVRATGATGYFAARSDPCIRLAFNNPVDPTALRPLLAISPVIPFTITASSESIILHSTFEPGTRYTVNITRPAKAAKGLPRATALSATIPDRDPGVWFESEGGYLSAAGNRTVLAHVVNLTDIRATVTRVYDNNLVNWRNAGGRSYWRGFEEFSRPLAVRDFHIPTRKNEKQELRLSLDDLLSPADAWDGVYRISLVSTSPNEPKPRWTQDNADDDSNGSNEYYGGAATVVTLSDIGLSARQGRDEVTIWATSLRTAKPLSNIRVRLFSSKNQAMGEGTTDADGLARIATIAAGPGEKPAVVIAEQLREVEVKQADPDGADTGVTAVANISAASQPPGAQLTWLDLRSAQVNSGDIEVGGRPYLRKGYEAFVYTDRGVYRPGETVHLRAIVRGADNAMPSRFPVRWLIRRPDLRDWKSEMSEIDLDGASTLELALPTDLPSGNWTAQIGLPGGSGASATAFGSVSLSVEDFVPQRMKVVASIDGATGKDIPRMAAGDDPIVVRLQADYLFGRPVSERPATAVVRIDPIPFQPGGFRDWTFGDIAGASEAAGHAAPLGRRSEFTEAATDGDGRAKWDVDFDELLEKGDIANAAGEAVAAGHGRPSHRKVRQQGAARDATSEYPGPWRLTFTGSVSETGGRAVTASRQIDIDRLPYYIGLKARDTALRPDVQSTFDVRLITPTGAQAADDTALEYILFRETWNSSYIFEKGHYRFQSTRVLERAMKEPGQVAVTKGRGEIQITPADAGSYVLTARDVKTGAMTSINFYAGYGIWEDNISRENPEKLDLVIQPSGTDGKLHIGDTAQVVVRSPFAGQLLLAIETDGIISSKVIEMPASHMSVPIDITDACRPNAYVSACVIRAINPGAPWVVHRAIGVTRLNIDNSDRQLKIELAAPMEIRPQASLGVKLRVLDAMGNPAANVAVTVAAVDEGICQLTNFATPDPFAYFTGKRALGVRASDVFGQLMPETDKPQKQSSVGGDEDGGSLRRNSPIGGRRFRPVALVSAVLHTDGDGLASADFSLPQFNGQLRIMAVASQRDAFGSAQTPVLVRSPLLVQSSWPRFAAPGDKFSVPLTLFNNSTAAGSVAVNVQLDNGPLRFAGNTPERLSLRSIDIRANGQASVAFDVIALDRTGLGHAHLVATMNGETFEEDIELPVRPASPWVVESGTAVAKTSAPATFALPQGFLEGTTQFRLRVCSSQDLQLPQGLDYLDRYPYGCVEQTVSTLFPLVYLNDLGQKIAPTEFDTERVTDKVRVGMLRLLSMQTTDGGLSMWPGGRDTWPWASIYAAHFLVEAQAAGYDVPEELRDPLMNYARGVLNQPQNTPDEIELQSYAAYVTALAGKPQRAAMERLSEVIKDEEAGSARFHLAAAWLAAGRRDRAAGLIPNVIPAAQTNRALSGNVGSAVRDRAVLISTLLAVDPEDARIEPLVQQLADAGRAHQWRSTQDTAFAVMAIGRYLRHSRGEAPFETAQLLLGGKTLASSSNAKPLIWTAGSLDPQINAGSAPALKELPAAGAKLDVRITGPDAARAHISWLETGVKTTPPPSADSGMTIRRRYLDEHGKPLEAMRVRSGDLVQIELTIQSITPLSHIVIEDLLPAGLEIENSRLLGSGPDVETHPSREESPAFEVARTDMRDDRLILVGDLVRAGSGKYLYTARAVASGHFVLPPVKGECMYDSGTNSLWGDGTFEVTSAGNMKVAHTGD